MENQKLIDIIFGKVLLRKRLGVWKCTHRVTWIWASTRSIRLLSWGIQNIWFISSTTRINIQMFNWLPKLFYWSFMAIGNLLIFASFSWNKPRLLLGDLMIRLSRSWSSSIWYIRLNLDPCSHMALFIYYLMNNLVALRAESHCLQIASAAS